MEREVISSLIFLFLVIIGIYRFVKRKLVLVQINDDSLVFNRALTGELVIYANEIHQINIEIFDKGIIKFKIQLKEKKNPYLIDDIAFNDIINFGLTNKIPTYKKVNSHEEKIIKSIIE